MITRRAYAKINLSLSVTGIRSDGYHLLDTLMQTVSLYDTVILEEASDIQLVTNAFPGPENLAYKAAELFRKETGTNKGARITLQKRIPAGAGLGGGSADAAAVLLGLKELWGVDIPRERMLGLAAKLGADVPFALHGGLARCRGVGEELEPLPALPDSPLLLVFPGEGVSTIACYKAWDRGGYAPTAGKDAPQAGQEAQFFAELHNALEAPALDLVPSLSQVRSALEKTGPLGCCMTGSGAAYFAIYRSDDERAQAMEALRHHPWQLFPVEFIDPKRSL